MQDAWPSKETQPEVRHHIVRIEGAGAADPEKEFGNGVTVTRLGAGNYKATWAENPGRWLGAPAPGLEAATPGDLAGHTVVFDTYDSATFSVEFFLYNSAFAAHDLAANEWINLDFRFKQTSV